MEEHKQYEVEKLNEEYRKRFADLLNKHGDELAKIKYSDVTLAKRKNWSYTMYKIHKFTRKYAKWMWVLGVYWIFFMLAVSFFWAKYLGDGWKPVFDHFGYYPGIIRQGWYLVPVIFVTAFASNVLNCIRDTISNNYTYESSGMTDEELIAYYTLTLPLIEEGERVLQRNRDV